MYNCTLFSKQNVLIGVSIFFTSGLAMFAYYKKMGYPCPFISKKPKKDDEADNNNNFTSSEDS